MAKRRVNKSAKIREALETMGRHARPKAVVEALAAKRIKVTPAAVSQIKTSLRNSGNGQISMDALLEAKKLADKLGLDRAQAALDALARLR